MKLRELVHTEAKRFTTFPVARYLFAKNKSEIKVGFVFGML